MAFHPYLVFSGTCRAAFTHYQAIFGGELEIMSMSEAPDAGDAWPDADPNLVLHAALVLDDALLMGSDDPGGEGGPMAGAAVHFSAADEAAATRIFGALAEGGEITMPFGATFWSSGFGMCTDRFGIPWMIDAGDAEQMG